jgi:hypothetical protein
MKKLINGMQGDVQFKMIASLPTGAKRVNNKPLAYGEVSGHVHIITGNVDLFEIEGKTYAVVGNDGARLQHIMESSLMPDQLTQVDELPVADHKSILLPPGTYEIGIQKQFNPYEKVFEQVKD